MRELIKAKEGYWITQSESNLYRPRIFVKQLPVNYREYWTEWSDEQYEEYIKEHPYSPLDIFKYAVQFDYSKYDTGNIFGSPIEREKPGK